MEINADDVLYAAIREGVREGITQKFKSSYNNPMDKIVEDALAKHKPAIVQLIADSIGSLIEMPDFRDHIRAQVGSHLSKQLIQKFGGELEKQVNALKSDPATRARITLAIDKIVTERS